MQEFNDIVLWLRLHSIIPMIVVFAAIVLATYWPGRRNAIERNGMILFRDDDR